MSARVPFSCKGRFGLGWVWAEPSWDGLGRAGLHVNRAELTSVKPGMALAPNKSSIKCARDSNFDMNLELTVCPPPPTKSRAVPYRVVRVLVVVVVVVVVVAMAAGMVVNEQYTYKEGTNLSPSHRVRSH